MSTTKDYAGFENLRDEALLDALDQERRKFTRADEAAVRAMTDLLIARGVYPTETHSGNPNTVHQMVGGYGARWHLWEAPIVCMHCAADIRDHEHGPPYKREIAVVENDNVSHHLCPDCGRRLTRVTVH